MLTNLWNYLIVGVTLLCQGLVRVNGKFGQGTNEMATNNPLSPINIHIQILQTDLHTFPLRISLENLVKDQIVFSL